MSNNKIEKKLEAFSGYLVARVRSVFKLRRFMHKIYSGWFVFALIISVIVLLPILSIFMMGVKADLEIWSHLWRSTLPRYLKTTLYLSVSVGVLASTIGLGVAWLISMYRFPLSKHLEWMLLLPLGIPAYIGAYAVVDFLEYAGPFQTLLRDIFGWQSSRDYWFPEVRSLGAAVVILSAASFPYVYLIVRSALREQSGATFETARALGAGPWKVFFRVAMPLMRPALAAGAAIVMMETISDFGTVEYFSVQTLTTGIFTTWLVAGNANGAAQIASLVLIVIFLLLGLEKYSRGRAKFHIGARSPRPVVKQNLTGLKAVLALVFCLIPFLIGFVLPVAVMGYHALGEVDHWVDDGMLNALKHTLIIAGATSLITVLLAICVVYGVRLTGARFAKMVLPITTIGYAAPGAVLGLGLLFPLAALDHKIADFFLQMTGQDPGLLLTGSAFAIILACTVRFFAVAQGGLDAAMGQISPSLPMAARSLGQNLSATLRKVYMPLIRGSVGTALLLVFVDVVKELPATLLLRPFNYDTLATRVYEKATLEQLEEASPAALLVMCVGIFAILLLAKTQLKSQK